MKKIIYVLSAVLCLSFICLFTSCSDSKEPSTGTTELSEKNEILSGKYNDTINWKYDESTRTFSFSGTGKIDKSSNQNIENIGDYWTAVTESIKIEEGITDIDNNDFLIFDFAKTLYLPSSYIGSVPELKNIE